VGGDYYDHLDLGDGRALIVIADVSGKGVPAALLMSGFRASLLSQDLPRIEITELVRRLNESVVRSVRPGRFVTAFVAFVDGTSGRVEYVNAGHNPPVLVRHGGAEPETLTEGGPLLGPVSGARFERGETALAAGDLLALYTDGVTEGADASGAMWGEERLAAALVARASDRCTTIVRTIAADVRAFEGATGPADDITLLAARRIAIR
jgi:sigma-B regulation protein RsbU (phosphoserine phosphatase)